MSPVDSGGVWIASQKWDGSFNRGSMLRPLTTDEHGAWFAGVPGREVRWRSGESGRAEDWSVLCVPRRAWWRATWYSDGHSAAQVYVDVGHPLTDDPLSPFLDLDLDVEGPASGPFSIVDQDEFAENTRRFGYPTEVVERVERSALEVVGMLGGPIASVALKRLDALCDPS